MRLIEEIEISYFRSFYKFKIRDVKDLNIIFGKNDSGKSNVVRALNLFFSGRPEHAKPFEFPIDFCERRLAESEASGDVRKFLYVKITFNTPQNFQPSLGKRFYVKRQWSVSRGQEYNEEISVPTNRRNYATRLLNKIKFIYIPAIKDVHIFEMLLAGIHETVANSPSFEEAVGKFSEQLQKLTSEMFQSLPKEVSTSTKIGAPTQLSQLFQTLDFETIAEGETKAKSLTRQRGDGIKVRHIPELLNFISDKDNYEYHIWGFEEPENSLDFVSAQSEAQRLLTLAKQRQVQIFITTHSQSFYLLDEENITKIYIRKDKKGTSNAVQGRELVRFDPQSAIGEGFYLPAAAEALRNLAALELRAKEAEAKVGALRAELEAIASPVVLTEGRTDASILLTAWRKLRGCEPPFAIRSCETGGENAGGGNGGAQSLGIRLKGVAADHPHAVIGIFDYDPEGIKAYQLDKNFIDLQLDGVTVKKGMHGQSYAACLLAPEFRNECKEYQNLPIEYLFRDGCIEKKIDGKSLLLKRKKASTMVGSKKIEMELENLTHLKEVVGEKIFFAERIVPTFLKKEFDGFEPIFAMIDAIISYNNK